MDPASLPAVLPQAGAVGVLAAALAWCLRYIAGLLKENRELQAADAVAARAEAAAERAKVSGLEAKVRDQERVIASLQAREDERRERQARWDAAFVVVRGRMPGEAGAYNHVRNAVEREMES